MVHGGEDGRGHEGQGEGTWRRGKEGKGVTWGDRGKGEGEREEGVKEGRGKGRKGGEVIGGYRGKGERG